MGLFAYSRAAALGDASASGRRDGAMFIAGGTDLLQLIREGVASPDEVVDINAVVGGTIEAGPDGVRIAAGARLVDVAAHPAIRQGYACVAEALLETASPQVRNMASVGGNLLQRTRCLYFRDVATPCNKREPGSGCPAIGGQNRINAILGGSENCIATHPSDLAVALLACDAVVVAEGADGERRIALADFHRLPGDTPHIETALSAGEVITAIELPAAAAGRRSRYLKVRDRASFEWAIASCAVALRLDAGAVGDIRVVAGGVATRPWRLEAVEAALRGQPLTDDAIATAAALATQDAVTHGRNEYKVPLLTGTVRKALREMAA